MKTQLELVVPQRSIEEVAREYFMLKRQIRRIESELDPLRHVLEGIAKQALGIPLRIGDYTVTLTEASRENFALKTAQAVLGVEVLKPWITVTHFTQLRVDEKRRGE